MPPISDPPSPLKGINEIQSEIRTFGLYAKELTLNIFFFVHLPH